MTGMSRPALSTALPSAVWLLCVSLAMVTTARADDETPDELLGLPKLYEDDFSSGKADRWEASDPKAWRIEQVDGKPVLSQFQQSKVKTPVRSPFNRSVIKDLVVGDFVLDVELKSTAREYDHRSLCLFFGYQDPSHLYYVHFGKKTDDHANQIFIVNDEPRTKISTKTTPGTNWDDQWHHARIVRDVESGKIDVFFDDMEQPVMTASDQTFRWGQVGVGSFDDTGHFRRVTVYGKRAQRQ